MNPSLSNHPYQSGRTAVQATPRAILTQFMHAKSPAEHDPQAHSADDNIQVQTVHRMLSTIEALNARIARLAIGLGVRLDSNDDLARAMSSYGPAVSHERRSATQGRAVAHATPGPDRRVSHLHDELRGLLVLRYGVQMRYVEQFGAGATLQVLVEVEAHLARDGFKTGADGINLDRLFKEP